jgi:N-acetylmuramic acid 6-phosphate etherase
MDVPGTLPATESVDPRYQDLDAWDSGTALQALWEAQLAAAAAVGPALPSIRLAVAAAASRLAAGGRLIYAGAGTSGRIAAQDGVELPPTFDWPRDRLLVLMAGGEQAFIGAAEGAEDDAAAGARTTADHALGAADVVLGVAASGATRFTCACLEAAAAAGCLTVAVANSPDGRLLSLAAYPILVATGPEPLAGSTRLKAGTAQKIVLNLFSTLLMVRLGRVHRGLMVDMRPSNDKLRLRALRMVRDLTGAAEPAALAALDTAGGHVKLAVLLLHGLSPEAARDLLRRGSDSLRAALALLPS